MDEKLRNLLNVDHDDGFAKSLMGQVKNTLVDYIASPWNPKLKRVITKTQYLQKLKEFVSKNFSVTQEELCKPGTKFLDTDPEQEYKDILCQAHAGNLLEHSQWAALQILKWNYEGNVLVKGLDLNTLVISAFFHDIGKGGDCVKSCSPNECWLDIYAPDKYNREGDPAHPKYSGNLLLGKSLFFTNCSCMLDKCGINIKDLIESEFPAIDIRVVALTAYMHWEFGKINMPFDWETGVENPMICRLNAYIKKYVEYCKLCQLNPKNITYLKMCIAVSCADISAGTNVRLLPNVDGLIPAKTIYLGKDPWTLYGMDKKYESYRSEVLNYFKTVFPQNTVTTPVTYANAFEKGEQVVVKNLVGRVLRGQTDADFLNLSPDPNRKLIMFMASDGLQELINKSLTDILITIGYPVDYIKELLRSNTKFKLLVASEQDEILPATWDNLLTLITIQYVNTNIPRYLEQNLDELKSNSFNTGFSNIMKARDPSFSGKMTAERLNYSKGSLWEMRQFLNDVLNLNELYMGDGYTYTKDGEKGVAEYFSLNAPIKNLRDVLLINLI
uniref:HD/PDEase domain-containing protein n=1 Tax=viral metagenome TaxID=1070528 RepID=A0A6C0KPT3_9ZZZZ